MGKDRVTPPEARGASRRKAVLICTVAQDARSGRRASVANAMAKSSKALTAPPCNTPTPCTNNPWGSKPIATSPVARQDGAQRDDHGVGDNGQRFATSIHKALDQELLGTATGGSAHERSARNQNQTHIPILSFKIDK